MKDGWIRAGAVAPLAPVADVCGLGAAAVREAADAASRGVDLLVMPEYTLTGGALGDLVCQSALLSAAETALAAFIAETASLPMLTLLGLPIMLDGRIYSAAAAVSGGRLLALVTREEMSTRHIPFAGFSDVPCGSEILLRAEALPSLTVGVCFGDETDALDPPSSRLAAAGATVIACLSCRPELIGMAEKRHTALSAQSARILGAVVYAAAGMSESGTDLVFSGAHAIYSSGRRLAETTPFAGGLLSAVVDTEQILLERARASRGATAVLDTVSFSLPLRETALDVPPRKNPFLPEDEADIPRRCALIFELCSRALAARMERAHASTLVLGVSGGLDSTLALLVASQAAKLRSLPSNTVHAVTMPCFGTTERTHTNAERLSEALGARLSVIDICASVMRHFADIGHDPESYTAVYENAQARERTQVLMDIANAEGGLVVGTGDLSELALGWATYNGDHMSMYAVNADIPKTLLRAIVSFEADRYRRAGNTAVSDLLADVLATPVSPELLPPRDGVIAQCTEELVGPYELHDFFLYHLVHRGFAPHKILRMAVSAFDGAYTEGEIRAWLAVFLRRFFSQQFKRSCLPDGVRIGSLSLSPRGGHAMPSDASYAVWLADLEAAPVYRKDGTTLG